jgi:serine O-acetyltransferase
MLEKYKKDINRYVAYEQKPALIEILSKEGLWALAEYRFNHWIYYHCDVPILRQILLAFGSIWHKLIMIITGVELPKQAKIGSGLYIAHMGCIVLHPDVKLGNNCTISHDVTIGVGGRGNRSGSPKIGDRVYIAPGARIFGAITIGNDVAIGANAVVTKDIPDNAVAVGIPAKVISYKGSKDFIQP